MSAAAVYAWLAIYLIVCWGAIIYLVHLLLDVLLSVL